MSRRFDRKSANAEWRLYLVGFVMLCGLCALGARLWYEQVLRGPKWTARLASRSEVTVRIPSVRGEIRDRHGLTLVENRASYSVDFYLPDMVRGYRRENGATPVVEYVAPVRQMKTRLREPDIVRIVNESVVPRLDALKLAADYNAERLQKHFRNDTEVPFNYREEIDFPTLARFAENNLGLPGVDIGIKPVRQYRYGALAAHLLGYVGAVRDIDQQPDVRDFTFYEPDVEGKSQVELYLDQWIRGTPGVRVMQRSVKGVIEGEVRRVPPKQGHHVLLTIDAWMQFIAERALRESGIGRGAVVLVNPNNGDILAMASVPSFDPNMFIPSIAAEDWKKVNDDETDPLTNRAVQGYAPGSTYKTVTALGGLRAGLPASRTFHCSGGVTYGDKYMRCWIADKGGTHGTLSLPDALKHSCNAFFYQWGNAAGIEQIDAVGEALGLGKKTGVPLSGESPGILPSPEWLKTVSPGERWSTGYTANTSIGQGFVLASPLQMAMVTATIANGGVSYEPRLVHRIVDREGHDARDPKTGGLVAPPEPKIRADLRSAGVKDQQIEAVREGMRRVVFDGTGKRAQIKGVTVAGKTGTAQFWRGDKKDNHTWFLAFAPYEAAQYAVCVMVQGAKSGGGVSAPIAQKILEECLALEKGYDPGLTAVKPAVGSFTQIEMVSYKQSAVSLQEDQETADNATAPIQTEKTRTTAPRPDIRVAADTRGRIVQKPARPVAPIAEKRNFFERFFGLKRPAPPPASRPAGR
ncbi:MAG: penicillin-binding protein 2 [Chthoniobacter sp.]|jgi:penicillin-binding protein 2|nr:penicillin-binding protein 2 [Chthoniobacter sp.]